MAVLKTKRSRWIAGTIGLLVTIAGTLIGLPTGGTAQDIPLNMSSTTAVKDFAPITPPGLVPANVVKALLVPTSSTPTKWRNYDQGNGPYDRQVQISVKAGFSATKEFFTVALKDKAWKILSSQDANGGYEILALHPGTDSRFWEIGATIVSNTAGGKSASPNGNLKAGGTTSVDLRLLQYQSA